MLNVHKQKGAEALAGRLGDLQSPWPQSSTGLGRNERLHWARGPRVPGEHARIERANVSPLHVAYLFFFYSSTNL